MHRALGHACWPAKPQQLESEIAQLDELNSKLDALLFNSSTSSSPHQSTSDNSEA